MSARSTTPSPARARRLVASLAGALLLAAATRSRAADDAEQLRDVLVVIEPAAQGPLLAETTRRVAAELGAAGFRVAASTCAPGLRPGCAEPWPAGASAVVELAFVWRGRALAIEALIARSADTRPVRLQSLVAGAPEPEPTVIAVRATELVRAGALAVLRPEPPAVVATPAAEPSGARGPGRIFVEVGPALVQSTAGLGSAWGPALRGGTSFAGSWFAAAWIVAPTFGAELRAPAGGAQLRSGVGGLELGHRWRPLERLHLALAFGGGAYHLSVRGQEAPPLQAAESTLWTPFLAATGGLAVPFGGRWALHADVRAAFVRTAAVVRIAGDERGASGRGRPLIVAGLRLGAFF